MAAGDKLPLLMELGVLHWDTGNMVASKDFYTQALELARSAGQATQATYCTVALRIHDLYMFAKDQRAHEKYKEAIASFRSAIELARNIHSLDHELKCLRQMGATYWNINQFDMFRDLNLQALEIATVLHHQGEQGVCHNNIALSFWKRSDYSNAIRHFQTALEIADRNHLELDKSDCTTNLGLLYSEFGDFDSALDYIASAMDVDAKANDPFNLAIDYNNYGMIQKNRGLSSGQPDQVQAAIQSYLRSNALAKALSNKYIQCITSSNIGEAYSGLGRYCTAIANFDSALLLARETGNQELEGQIDCNLGQAYLALNQADVAMLFYRETIRIALHAPYANLLWEAYFGIGRCYEAKRDFLGALRCYLQSIEIVDQIRSKILLETYKIGFSRNKLKVNEFLIHLIWEHGDALPYVNRESDIFNQIEKIKARAFLECLAESSIDILESMDDASKKELLDLSGRTSSLAVELAKPDLDDARRRTLQKELAREEENYFRHMSNLRLDHPALASLIAPSSVDLTSLQGLLADNDTAILDFFLGERRSYLIMIRRESVKIHPLPAQQEIEKAVAPFIKLMASPQKGSLSGRQAGKRLLDLLVPALRTEQPSSLKTLIIIPDGILNFLPFETLTVDDPGGNAEYLLQKFSISYAPSASILAKLRELRSKTGKYQGLLALGDPAYEGAKDNIRRSFNLKPDVYNKFVNSLVSLPISRDEIETAAAFFPPSQRTIFLGRQAREDVLKAHSPAAYQIIHLACHAVIDEKVPYRSSLILSQAPDGNEDGILHAWELYNLRLRANLVVLSACQTATGAVEKTEGVLGLTRIFFYAGAGSVLSTLWPISDQSTVHLMKGFYENLASGRSKAEALRNAKLAMLKSPYSDPYYWAGFVISGDATSGVKFNN